MSSPPCWLSSILLLWSVGLFLVLELKFSVWSLFETVFYFLILMFSGWKGGYRCALIDGEKPLTHSLCAGKLFLTQQWVFLLPIVTKPSFQNLLFVTFWWFDALIWDVHEFLGEAFSVLLLVRVWALLVMVAKQVFFSVSIIALCWSTYDHAVCQKVRCSFISWAVGLCYCCQLYPCLCLLAFRKPQVVSAWQLPCLALLVECPVALDLLNILVV